jgi:hypothetical protein
MPAKVFPCYPFAHFFEEEVTSLLADSLDDSFYLIHNAIRPNKRAESLLPKEIDLCILSKSCRAFFVEVKNYHNPHIDDLSIEDKQPNPVQEMKEYGQRLRSDLDADGERKFSTYPILLIRKKNVNNITPPWRLNCYEPLEFLNWLKQEAERWRQKSYRVSDQDMERIRENYLCCAKVYPFTGFDPNDLDSLRRYKKYSIETKDKEFKEEVLQPLYFKFRCMAYDIRSFLHQRGITLHQTIMSQEQDKPEPIFWGAFTLRDVRAEPQVAFHISTKDWYESGVPREDHFALKLAFFYSSPWMRKLMLRFRENPDRFVSLINETMPDREYRLCASREHDKLFISTPLSSPNLKNDLERLATIVLDDSVKLRSISFERPFYHPGHDLLFKWLELKTTVGRHFEILLRVLTELLPGYSQEVKKHPYG